MLTYCPGRVACKVGVKMYSRKKIFNKDTLGCLSQAREPRWMARLTDVILPVSTRRFYALGSNCNLLPSLTHPRHQIRPTAVPRFYCKTGMQSSVLLYLITVLNSCPGL